MDGLTIGWPVRYVARSGGQGHLEGSSQSDECDFSDVSFVAKMDLRRYVEVYVLPDGSPAPQKAKKQGKRPRKTTIQLDDGIKVHQGETGHSLLLYVRESKIIVGLNRKPGAKVNPAVVNILFDREIEIDDLTPEKIARALTSVVEITGYEPGVDIAAAFDATLETAEAIPEADTLEKVASPELRSLVVSTGLARVQAGATVELILEYSIDASVGSVTATETRTLRFGGALIPTFPISENLTRTSGDFTSNYRQPLPTSAQPGEYEFKGEVCVGGDCISRVITFEVVN